MKFLKPDKKYYSKQLQSSITNSLTFTIRNLYKQSIHKFNSSLSSELYQCKSCLSMLIGPFCYFCSQKSHVNLNQNIIRNEVHSEEIQIKDRGEESVIILVDLSGSMNVSYESQYCRINREFVEREIGKKDCDVMTKAIGQKQLIKNFQSIQMLRETGMYTIQQISQLLKNQIQIGSNNVQKQKEPQQYITRKQIVQLALQNYLNSLKTVNPNTQATVIYFNNCIQIPVDNFSDTKIFGDLEGMKFEELMEIGREAAAVISKDIVSEVSEKIIKNVRKNQPNGQTALTPALAFTVGLASKFNYNLHQIIIVTDGLSNIGLGQTESSIESQFSKTKQIYKQIGTISSKNNCVINIVTFQDCSIGYEILDEVVKVTGGIPYCITFNKKVQKEKKQETLVVNNQTMTFLNFQMKEGFSQSPKQFCYKNRLMVKCSRKEVKIVPIDLKMNIVKNQGNYICFQMGVRSANQPFSFKFQTEQDIGPEQEGAQVRMKFTILHEYQRGKKRNYVVREQLITLKKGTHQQVLESETKTLKQQLQKKIMSKPQFQSIEEYHDLNKKLQQRQEVANNISEGVLENFKKKKQMIQDYDKSTDKLGKDKRAMESRRKETYSKRKYGLEEEDIFD